MYKYIYQKSVLNLVFPFASSNDQIENENLRITNGHSVKKIRGSDWYQMKEPRLLLLFICHPRASERK